VYHCKGENGRVDKRYLATNNIVRWEVLIDLYRSEKAQLNLLLYFPSEYGKDPQKKWPLILFLHGGSEKGSDLERVKAESLPNILENRKDLPFIIASPQLSAKSGEKYWPQEVPVKALFTLLEEISSTYSVDQERIYFTGLSDGGAGVWEIGLSHPDYFTALVPLSGYYGYPFEVPDNICDLKEKPIWVFHGAEDSVIPLHAQQDLVNALEACGGDIQFTVYPDRGHEIGNLPYSNPELFEWMLSQQLE
jgi:predicted peptidase